MRASLQRYLWIVSLLAATVLITSPRPGYAQDEGGDPSPTATAVPAQTASAPLFTINVGSAYLRSVPESGAERVLSVFRGETYPAAQVSPDGDWVQLSGPDGQAGWLPVRFGIWSDGTGLEAVLGARTPWQVPPGVIASLSPRAIQVYRRGLALGNDPHAFAKIGDCNSENGRFLVMFDQPGTYELGDQFSFLQDTIDYYAGSFAETSVAARSGFSPAAILDATWADPAICARGESPLACEYRRLRPSVALIALGTHSGRSAEQFEADLRAVLDLTLNLGIVPILATKADNVEGDDHVNVLIRRLAREYAVPLWDFWAAAAPLPADGLTSDGIHLTFARPIFDDDWSRQQGWPWRNLSALLALDAVRQAVAPDAYWRGAK